MTVGGYQDFINKFGNDNITVITQLKTCLSTLNRICNCQKQRKYAKSEECNNLYINIVKSTMINMTEYLKTKTVDDEIIFHHNGSHEILRIKLR